jgi:hypothetical protein
MWPWNTKLEYKIVMDGGDRSRSVSFIIVKTRFLPVDAALVETAGVAPRYACP